MTKVSSKRPRRLSDRQMLAELREALMIAFIVMDEYDPKEVSNRTGLCLSTIYRLQSKKKLTINVRYSTVMQVCTAAGLILDVTQDGVRLSLNEDREVVEE